MVGEERGGGERREESRKEIKRRERRKEERRRKKKRKDMTEFDVTSKASWTPPILYCKNHQKGGK